MAILDTILAWISFALVCFSVSVAPWLFGAWEMWWFWPFAVCIFAAGCCFSIRLILGTSVLRSHRIGFSPIAAATVISFVILLAYAFVRSNQSPVYMDAERSLLLFLTAFILASIVVVGFSKFQLRALYAVVVADLFCLGIYGIVNHWITKSSKVLWVISEYTQYAGRASGTYFCPDHYSGLMELLLALALGLLLTPSTLGLAGTNKKQARGWRFAAGFMIAVSLYGIWLSQSRGGGLTALAVIAVSLLLWTARFRPQFRWSIRLGGLAAAIAGLLILWHSNSTYVARFKELLPIDQSGKFSLSKPGEYMRDRVTGNIRYNIYSAALRAWRDVDPWFGIGPGMHQHLWFHYAASPDGDRAKGIWPTRPNSDTHAHQVHSDWLQLLEEYGIAGVAIFLGWMFSMLVFLIRGLREGVAPALTLGAIICFACMGLHSLVDFNLQIPATVWLFSAIVAIPFALIQREG